ncbi:MAG: phenylalanine--tRNA ligase subunit beta [Eubacteriaceae bacterium]|jgi:phenylalanyl-tRNA synthetase beta chain
MLTSLNWLNEYVHIDEDPVDIERILTMSGTKVETIDAVNDTVEGIISGIITKIEKHPNADRLQVCTVDIGTDKPLTIITSATNVFEGAHVPVAVSGSTIADGTRMHDTEFRGINSQGMFCSVEELGMNTDLFAKEITDGIYILPESIAAGEDMKSLLWVDDQIIDIELTANRGDCQSIYGIAREAAAAFDRDLKPLDLTVPEGTGDIGDYLKVSVDTDLCPRYTTRMFKVNKIEPSPLWMQLKLLNSGVRPINNIVDITNYVMLETGQPLHAFDYRGIGTDTIAIRTDNPQASVVTLDEKERPITKDMMMITNGEKPIAVAGVMGGMNSEIADDTELVVLESACFDKTSIRLTSKALGLRTEASARYEKGINPELSEIASDRAARLFEQIGAAQMIGGFIDIGKKASEPVTIPLDTDWLNRFIGIDISIDEITGYLEKLYMSVEKTGSHQLLVTVPDYRLDLRLREDLAEEVARLYGYNRILNTIMSGETTVGERTPDQKFRHELTEALIGAGAEQTLTSSFISARRLGPLAASFPDAVKIINPLGEENSLMRPTLLGHQLELIGTNLNRGNESGTFFEFAKTYAANPEKGELPLEENRLALSSFGETDFFGMKGLIELILKLAGTERPVFEAADIDWMHPGRSAAVSVNGVHIGSFGEIHPAAAKKLDLPGRILLAELSMDALNSVRNDDIRFEALPKFPGSERDLALVLDKQITAGQVEDVIRRHGKGILQDVRLFDVYTGEQVPEGKKSLAYNLSFRLPDRTLTDDDITPVVDAILDELKTTYDAVLRA